MDKFSRAYRDPKSPLTPLTPLATNSAFSFQMKGDGSLKQYMDLLDVKRGKLRPHTVGAPQNLSPAGLSCGAQNRTSPKYCNSLSPSTASSTGCSKSSSSQRSMASSLGYNSSASSSTSTQRSYNSSYASSSRNSSSSSTSPRFCGAGSSCSLSSRGSTISCSSTSKSPSRLSVGCGFTSSRSSNSSYSASNCTALSSEYSCKSLKNTTSPCCSTCGAKLPRSSIGSGAPTTRTSASTGKVVSPSYTSGKSSSILQCNPNYIAKTSKLSSKNGSYDCQIGRSAPQIVVVRSATNQPETTVSSVLNWAWNQLSPFKNAGLYELLIRVGMEKYWEIFKREEIDDVSVFSTMTMKDLNTIGITNIDDCIALLKAVKMALELFLKK